MTNQGLNEVLTNTVTEGDTIDLFFIKNFFRMSIKQRSVNCFHVQGSVFLVSIWITTEVDFKNKYRLRLQIFYMSVINNRPKKIRLSFSTYLHEILWISSP